MSIGYTFTYRIYYIFSNFYFLIIESTLNWNNFWPKLNVTHWFNEWRPKVGKKYAFFTFLNAIPFLKNKLMIKLFIITILNNHSQTLKKTIKSIKYFLCKKVKSNANNIA